MPQGDTDLYNPRLPQEVRQMLALTSQDYEVQRLQRAELNWRYYKGTMYEHSFLTNTADGSARMQRQKQLYDTIRPLYNVVAEAVDCDVDLCFSGARPVPADKADEALQKRLDDKWDRFGWSNTVNRSPLFGAVTGDSYMRVIPGWIDGRPDDPSRMEVYGPEVMQVLRDQHNRHELVAAKLEYLYTETTGKRKLPGGFGDLMSANSILNPSGGVGFLGVAPNEEQHTYTLIITKDAYYTFKDHKLNAFGSQGNSWANPLGAVPVIHIPFIDIGEDSGLPTFYSALPTMDAINELESMFGQAIRLHADPFLLAYGINPSVEITKRTTRDGTTVLYIPLPPQFTNVTNQNPPRLEFLEWSGNIGQLTEFLSNVKVDLEYALPELQIKRMSTQAKVSSGYQAQIQLMRLTQKIRRIRKSQFDALERVMQMALVSDDLGEPSKSTDPERGAEALEEARNKYDLQIHADPILPRDDATEANVVATDLANKVISLKEARTQRGFTLEEAARLEGEVEDDLQREHDMLMEQQQEELEMQMQAQKSQMKMQMQMQQQQQQMQMDMMQQQMKLEQQKMEGMIPLFGQMADVFGSVSNPEGHAQMMLSWMQMLQTMGLGKMPGPQTMQTGPALPGQTPPLKPAAPGATPAPGGAPGAAGGGLRKVPATQAKPRTATGSDAGSNRPGSGNFQPGSGTPTPATPPAQRGANAKTANQRGRNQPRKRNNSSNR